MPEIDWSPRNGFHKTIAINNIIRNQCEILSVFNLLLACRRRNKKINLDLKRHTIIFTPNVIPFLSLLH